LCAGNGGLFSWCLGARGVIWVTITVRFSHEFFVVVSYFIIPFLGLAWSQTKWSLKGIAEWCVILDT
jgi:hypothetical protein